MFCLLWFSNIAWFCVFRRIIYTVNTEKSKTLKLTTFPLFIFSIRLQIWQYSKLNRILLTFSRSESDESAILLTTIYSYFEPAIKLAADYKWALEKRVAPGKKGCASKKSRNSKKKPHQQKKSRTSKKKLCRKKKVTPAKKKRCTTGNRVCARIWCCTHTCMMLYAHSTLFLIWFLAVLSSNVFMCKLCYSCPKNHIKNYWNK